MRVHAGPCGIIQDNTGPYRTRRDQTGPNGKIRDHTGPYGNIRNILEHTGPWGARHVLLDSLEDTLDTPRRLGNSKEARDFKIDTELFGKMEDEFLTSMSSSILGRTLRRHLGYGVLLNKQETSKFIQSFLGTCILHCWQEIYHWLQWGTTHVPLDSLEDDLETGYFYGS